MSRVERMSTEFIPRFVTVALFSTYYFGLSVYIVFIAESCKQLVDDVKGEDGKPVLDINKLWYIASLLIVMVPLGLIRNLKRLVPFSTIANICIIIGLIILSYYLLRSPKDISSRHLYPRQFSNVPLFFVTVLFAMEGIGTVLPVENTMRNPQNIGGYTGVIAKAMLIVILLFGAVGFFGYLEYGDETKGSITLSLPTDEWGAKAVKALFAVAILFTYPLQFYVPCCILWDFLSPRITADRHNMAQILMRSTMVLIIVGVAMVVPRLDIIIQLIGSIFFSMLGLFIPPIIEIVTHWERGFGCLNWMLWKDISLVLLSIFACVSGTWLAVYDVIYPAHTS